MRKKLDKLSGEQLVRLFGKLFDPSLLPPDTPEEVDAELRSAGLDPEKIGRETVALVKKLSREAHERLDAPN